MGGKAILLVVLGFSIIFSVVNFNASSTTTRAMENLSEYYSKTHLHNIASSGANMAANKVFRNPNWSGSYSKLPFEGGELDISVTTFSVDKKRIISKARYYGIFDGKFAEDSAIVKIILQPSSFGKFGYYTNRWPVFGYLVTGDTIDGPFHTQERLNTLGMPVFTGKVTTLNGLNAIGNSWGIPEPADPQFLGGFESPVDIPFDLKISKLNNAANFNGKLFTDPVGDPLDVRLNFIDDGSLIGKVEWSTKKTSSSTWSTPILASMDTLAPNGVLWNNKGNMYLSGTVNGKYTVGTAKDGSNHGNVYLEDDVTYRDDPLKSDPLHPGYTVTNPACKDMLGIVAAKQVIVKNNTANRNSIDIHASLFNYDGGISVEGLTSGSPNMGIMRIHGGLIENEAKTTGYTNGAGYNQVIKFDKRFSSETPPYFPATESYEVVSWFE